MDNPTRDYLLQRTAVEHAKFLLPYLPEQGRILDFGCGPGTITTSLAEMFPLASFVGLDIDPSILAGTKQNAHGNIEFRVGSVYSMPFDDSTFDLVYSHAVFQHLENPSLALDQMRRVLTNNGILCIRIPDWTQLRVLPASDATEQAIDRFLECHYGDRSDPRIGPKLEALVTNCSFTLELATSSVEYNDASKMLSNLAARLKLAGYTDEANHLASMSSDPQAIFNQTWREIIATKKNG